MYFATRPFLARAAQLQLSTKRAIQTSSSRVQRQAHAAITNNATTASLSASASASTQNAASTFFLIGGGAIAILTIGGTNYHQDATITTTQCSALSKSGGDIVMLAPHKERSTGIMFPGLCNGMSFTGCGVRIKYGFVKVYAVGTYMDPMAMSAVKKQGPAAIGKALLDTQYPRTIRIVMNRGLSIEKYTAAIVEAIGPRMNGEDLEKLEEFKKLNPPVDLVEGAEMEMTVRGNIMLYKNALGGVGQIDSVVFCKALCDLYYGDDPASPGHKEEVIKGVQKL